MNKKATLKYIPLGKIVAGRFNVREALKTGTSSLVGEVRTKTKPVDLEGIEDLSNSILSLGQLQNSIVRELPNGGYELIAGSRRYKATKRVIDDPNYQIPALVLSKDTTDEEAYKILLTENFQRKKLTYEEFGSVVFDVVSLKIGNIAIPGYPKAIDEDDIKKAMWIISYRLNSIKTGRLSEGFENLLSVVESETKNILSAIGFYYIDFFKKIVPVSFDPELGEEIKSGVIDLTDVPLLAKLKQPEEVKEILKAEKEKIKEINIMNSTEEEKEEDLEIVKENEKDKLKKKLQKEYTQEDYDLSSIIREATSKVGLKKEDLSPIKHSEKKILNDNIEPPDKGDIREVIGKEWDEDNLSVEDIAIAAQKADIVTIENFYKKVPESKKSDAAETLLNKITQSLSDKAKEILSQTESEAFDELFDWIIEMSDGATNKDSIRTVGYPNEVSLEIIARFYKSLGELLLEKIKIIPLDDENKKEPLSSALNAMRIVFSNVINTYREKEIA